MPFIGPTRAAGEPPDHATASGRNPPCFPAPGKNVICCVSHEGPSSAPTGAAGKPPDHATVSGVNLTVSRPQEKTGFVVVPHEGPSSAPTGGAGEPPDHATASGSNQPCFPAPGNSPGFVVVLRECPSSARIRTAGKPPDRATVSGRNPPCFPAPGKSGFVVVLHEGPSSAPQEPQASHRTTAQYPDAIRLVSRPREKTGCVVFPMKALHRPHKSHWRPTRPRKGPHRIACKNTGPRTASVRTQSIVAPAPGKHEIRL